MGFFDTFSEKSKEVADKAKDQIDIAKLNSGISKEEKKIKEAYYSIGEKYVDLFRDNPSTEFIDYFDIINDAENQIKELKVKICKLKGISICPKCGEELENEEVFCPKCGAKVEDVVETPVDDTVENPQVIDEDSEK